MADDYKHTPYFGRAESLEEFWQELDAWSQATFGSDEVRGPQGPLKHLAKEVQECSEKPHDLEEYADLLFLVFDATRRAGFQLDELTRAAWLKLEKNKKRRWGPASLTEPVEHVRDEGKPA